MNLKDLDVNYDYIVEKIRDHKNCDSVEDEQEAAKTIGRIADDIIGYSKRNQTVSRMCHEYNELVDLDNINKTNAPYIKLICEVVDDIAIDYNVKKGHLLNLDRYEEITGPVIRAKLMAGSMQMDNKQRKGVLNLMKWIENANSGSDEYHDKLEDYKEQIKDYPDISQLLPDFSKEKMQDCFEEITAYKEKAEMSPEEYLYDAFDQLGTQVLKEEEYMKSLAESEEKFDAINLSEVPVSKQYHSLVKECASKTADKLVEEILHDIEKPEEKQNGLFVALKDYDPDFDNNEYDGLWAAFRYSDKWSEKSLVSLVRDSGQDVGSIARLMLDKRYPYSKTQEK